eukprot:4742417-Alexandrium_andersonii.AAC.1
MPTTLGSSSWLAPFLLWEAARLLAQSALRSLLHVAQRCSEVDARTGPRLLAHEAQLSARQ